MRRSALLFLSGLACAGFLPTATLAQSAAAERAIPSVTFGEFITEAASRFALPPAWLHAIMHAESRGKPRAISPKGAMGLMQIMPATWDYLRARHRLGPDAFDPHDNIIAGAGYIRELYDRYGSPGWIAAYNAGPGRYEAALRGRALPAETQAYVAVVAPAIGQPRVASTPTIAMVDRLAWTGSPIFVGRRDASGTLSAEPVDAQGIEPLQHADTGPATQTHGLFVARTAGAGPR